MAEYFASLGAKVVIADINIDDAKKVADRIQSDGNTAAPIKVDVSSEEDIRSMVSQTLDMYGTIDILINNAARGGGGALPQDLSLDKWREVYEGEFGQRISLLPGSR